MNVNVIFGLLFVGVIVVSYIYYNNGVQQQQPSPQQHEGFNTNSTNTAILNATAPVAPPSVPVCPVGCPIPWWNTNPIAAISSLYFGEGFNLTSVVKSGTINTYYMINVVVRPIACGSPAKIMSLSYNSATTNVTVETPNANDTKQSWLIEYVPDRDAFINLITNNVAKMTGPAPSCCPVPFFVIRAYTSNQFLYLNNSTFGVRQLGDYDDMKWMISQTPIQLTNSYIQPSTPVTSSTSPSSSTSLGNTLASSSTSPITINWTTREGFVSAINKNYDATNNNATNNNVYELNMTLPYSLFANDDDTNSTVATAATNNTTTTTNAYTEPIQSIIDLQFAQTNKTFMDAINNVNTNCDLSLNSPNLNEWGVRPYPCNGCPNNGIVYQNDNTAQVF